MTVTRFGEPVRVDYSEVEREWLLAAMLLPRGERFEAFRDISEMMAEAGRPRPVYAVQNAAYRIHAETVATQVAEARAIFVAARARKR